MKILIFSLMLYSIISCKQEIPVKCPEQQPVNTICIEGNYQCQDGTVRVPDMPDSYGCVKKGRFDYICTNPCPPYKMLLMDITREGKDVNGIDALTLDIISDVNLANMDRTDWAPSRNETFWIDPLPDNQGYRLHMFDLNMYRIWDESKQNFSKASLEGRMNLARDTMFLNIRYGWDPAQDFKENACDLVFVKSNL
jgi:hypothetical protein